MAEEDARVGADIAVNEQQHPPDVGGGGERIIKQQQQQNNNNNNHNNNKISLPVAMPRKSETKFIMGSTNYETDLLLSNKKKLHQQRIVKDVQNIASDSEEGFLSTSPDSANGEVMEITGSNVNGKKLLNSCDVDENLTNNKTKNLTTKRTATPPPTTTTTTTIRTIGDATTTINNNNNKNTAQAPIFLCTNPSQCVTLKKILDSFKAPLSEEQAWALIYQFMSLYRASVTSTCERHIFNELELPDTLQNLNLHRDGTVHCSWSEAERKKKEQNIQQQQQQSQGDDHEETGDEISALLLSAQKKILRQIAVIVYTALDYNLQADEQCQMSQELEELITYMTADENEDDCIDEGIDEGCRRWEDEHDDDKKRCETKEFDYVLEICRNHIKPTVAEEHYKAVCRALFTETIELSIFLQQVLHDGAHNLHLKADSQTSKQELAKLGFHDWARFWVQVIDELRRGVRLKKNTYEKAPIEYELTPYEILMEDIRSRKYQLRKVMVNGDIPPRVKKDAHAMILEFIRSRPPLKKASERQLPPPVSRKPSPREELMDSIRKGQQLKHIPPPITPRLKDRLLPPTSHNPMITSAPSLSTTLNTTPSAMNNSPTTETTTTTTLTNNVSNNALDSLKFEENLEPHTTQRSQQRLIKVDFTLLQDDDQFFDDDNTNSSIASASACSNIGVCSQPKMPPYPIGGYMVSNVAGIGSGASITTNSANNQTNCSNKTLTTSISTAPQVPQALTTRPLRRTTYDLATQCESRRASLRRHTIVGCQSNFEETHSMPTSRPDSRQSDLNANGVAFKKQLINSFNQTKYQTRRSESPALSSSSNNSKTCSRSSSSVGPWNKSFLDEKTWQERGDDRLSLTLEEIVHIRSVMTKAELEGLPVGVRVKEDVEKRKVCFLCLRTRFSIFGPWGIICKLCQRTVCSKCYTKMRIPSEHFRKVPLVLISPSLLSSPAGSSTPSPSHYAQHAHSSSTGNMLDENFPKSLIERLLRSESERKARSSVGSAPSSPKHQRSNMSTPGLTATVPPNQAVEALHDAANYANGNSARFQQTKPITQIDLMSRSMEGPRSLPVHSPARPYSNSSTLDRKSRFSRAFTLSSSGMQLSGPEQKENVRGEQVPVCNDCRGLVMEITSSSKQTRSSARNRALQNLTLDLSPVYK